MHWQHVCRNASQEAVEHVHTTMDNSRDIKLSEQALLQAKVVQLNVASPDPDVQLQRACEGEER